MLMRLLEPGGRPRRDGREFRESLGEGLSRALGSGTEEPAGLRLDADGAALPGQVGQRAGVAAVDARGKLIATGTRSGGTDRLDDQGDGLTGDQVVLEREAGGLVEQGGQRRARTPIGTSRQIWTSVNPSLYAVASRKVREIRV
jgi:hypothetical protein